MVSKVPRPREQNAVFQRMKTAELLVRGVYRHREPVALIFTSPPGLGKTTLIHRVCAETGQHLLKPRPSHAGLIAYVHKHSGRKSTIIFDDFDSVWGSTEQLSVFKILLDSRHTRTLSHDVKGPNRIGSFPVDCGVIFLSNKDFENPSQFGNSIWQSSILPIKQRCQIIALPSDPFEIYEYSGWLAIDGMLRRVHANTDKGQKNLTLAQSREVLDFFCENAVRFRDLSPRTLYLLAKARLSYGEHWINVAETGIMLSGVNPELVSALAPHLPLPNFADQLPTPRPKQVVVPPVAVEAGVGPASLQSTNREVVETIGKQDTRRETVVAQQRNPANIVEASQPILAIHGVTVDGETLLDPDDPNADHWKLDETFDYGETWTRLRNFKRKDSAIAFVADPAAIEAWRQRPKLRAES